MPASAGYKAFWQLDNAGLSLVNLSTYADNLSLPQSVEMLETTTFSAAGTNSKTFIPGLAGGDSISVSGPADTTLNTHITNCLGSQASNGSSFSVVYGAAGSVAAQPKQSCEVFVASYEVSTGVGGKAEFSASLQVTGSVTNGSW